MKKMYYVAYARMPTERAHGIQIAKMCEAFADHGIEVELVVPKRKTSVKESPYQYYGVKENFRIVHLASVDALTLGRLGFWVSLASFAVRVLVYLRAKEGLCYTRDEFVACLLVFLGKKTIWEAHMGQKNLFVRFLLRHRVPIVAISSGIKDLYVHLGARSESILVARDGVDTVQFNSVFSKSEARRKLGLDTDESIIVYTGSRQDWKGVDTLVAAAERVPEARLLIVSDRPPTEIPLYLRAADVVVLPNSAKKEISRVYTSPMKLFEYMASGTPIVASDVPSIREVLDNSLAYLSAPDAPEQLAQSIQTALRAPKEAAEKAALAAVKAREHSWNARAQAISDRFFI